MWKRLFCGSLIFGLAAAAPPVLSPALAQTACAAHGHIIERLADRYGEDLLGRGLRSSHQLYEIWRSQENGSWTILMLRPDGMACVMASGEAWTDAMPVLPGAES